MRTEMDETIAIGKILQICLKMKMEQNQSILKAQSSMNKQVRFESLNYDNS